MNKKQLAVLLLRILLGLTMALHGLQKVLGMAGTVTFFDSLGLPAFLPYFVATIELVGGIFMMIGLLVPLVSLGFVAVLVGAILTLKIGSNFVGGYELELLLIIMSVSVALLHTKTKRLFFKPNV